MPFRYRACLGMAIVIVLVRSPVLPSARAAERDVIGALGEVANAQDALVRASIENGKGGTRDTYLLAQRVIRLHLRNASLASAGLERAFDNLGAIDAVRGDYRRAIAWYRRAVAIRETIPGGPGLTDSLEGLASALIALERFDEGRLALDRARAARVANREAGSPSMVHNLELTAMLYRYRGDLTAARTAVTEARAILDRHPARHAPRMAELLALEGDISLLGGDMAAARDDYRAALDVTRRKFGSDHPATSAYLRRLGITEFALGNVSAARRLGEAAMQVALRAPAYCDPDTLRSMSDVSFPIAYEGDYTRARQLVEDALARAKSCLGDGHSLTATYVHNLGIHLQEMGDLREAERLHEQAVKVWTAALGPSHPFVARGLDQLAEALAEQGEHVKAREMYERALRIRRESLGPSHSDVAWTLTNLAREQASLGAVDSALATVQNAAAIYERSAAGSQDPDDIARMFALRGDLENRRGHLDAARASFSRALADRERLFGSGHPVVAAARADIARVDFEKGNYQAALTGALQAEQSGREHVRTTIRYLPERQAMAYAQSRAGGLDLALSVAATGDVAAARLAYDALIRSRGLVLDELVARVRFSGRDDPAIAPLADAVLVARQRFANLVMRSLREPVARALLDEARAQKEKAEQALAERSSAAQAELRGAQAGLAEIRRALPANAALVSYVKYDRAARDADRGKAAPMTSLPSYAAFFIRANSPEVKFVPLGAAAAIEKLVLAWQNEARRGSSLSERSYEAEAERLRKAIWDPVVAASASSSRLFIVPDGLLNVVNVSSLPVGDGKFIAEQPAVLHYLSTERDLLLDTGSASSRSLLVAGGPAFDVGPGAPPPRVAGFRSACKAFESRQFEDLPGSAQEANEISAQWAAQSAKGAVTLLSGRNATKTALKRALPGRRVIHLATHGFFLTSDCAGGESSLARSTPVTSDLRSNATFIENPLLLSGLAFAGANRRAAVPIDGDDGILTAEEIAAFNLRGTEWAVLSACDTGLGEIKAGEGVLGLRRAFQIAGVRTVIMSLWSVDDRATRAWMHALYDARLRQRLDTAAAVREASLSVLRDRRQRGLSTHPFYWAAFVAAGDWR